jgi:hypothetical protein
MLNGGDGGEDYGVVLAISAPGYVLKDLTADEREAERESHARQKDARARAAYEAALGGATWQEIADAHGYETTSGAYSAAHKYATKHGLASSLGAGAARRPTSALWQPSYASCASSAAAKFETAARSSISRSSSSVKGGDRSAAAWRTTAR